MSPKKKRPRNQTRLDIEEILDDYDLTRKERVDALVELILNIVNPSPPTKK